MEHEHESWDKPGTILTNEGDILTWKCSCGIKGKIPNQSAEYLDKLVKDNIIKIIKK